MPIFAGGVARALAERDELRGGRGSIPSRQRSASAVSQMFPGDFFAGLVQSSGLVSNERAFRESSWIRPLIHASAATLAARPFRMFQDGADGKKDQLKSNWLIDLMARPNIYAPLNEYSLKYQTFTLYFVDGEVLWHLGRSAESNIPKKSGKRAPVDFITIFRRRNARPSVNFSTGEFRGWDLSIDGKAYFADRTDVVHFPQYDPTQHSIGFNPFTRVVVEPGRGSSMLDTKRRAISADIAMAQFNLDYFGRGIASNYAFIGKGVSATQDEKDQFKDRLRAQFAGKNGDPFILTSSGSDGSGGWDVKYIGGANQRDAEYTKGRQTAKQEQMTGIAPPVIAGESDATYANATVQNLTWCETILIPAAMYYCAVLDVSLLADQPELWCDLSFDDVEALQYQKRERMKSIVELGKARVPLDIAARMNSVEMESFEGSDIPFGSYTDIPVTDILAGKDKAEIAVNPVSAPPAPVPDTPPVPDQPDVTPRFIRVVMDSDAMPEAVRVTEDDPSQDMAVPIVETLSGIIRADDRSLQGIAKRFHAIAASIGSGQILHDIGAEETPTERGVPQLLESRATLVTQVNRTTEEQVSDAVRNGIAAHGDHEAVAASVRAVFNARKKDADFVARQESTSALNGGRFLQLAASGIGSAWLASRNDRQCAIHPIGSKIDGEVVEATRAFSAGCRYPQDSEGPASASIIVTDGIRRGCDCLVVPANGRDLFRSEEQRAAYWKSNAVIALRNVERQFASSLGRYFNEQRGRVLAELAKQMARSVPDSQAAQTAIDDLAARGIKAAEPLVGSLTEQIRAIVAKAETIDDVPGLLRAAFPQLDGSKLTQLIARECFVAKLHGKRSAKK